MLRIIFLLLFSLLTLSACTENPVYAPVTEISTIEPLPKSGQYRVHADDTLYSIAWRYGLDYRYLAKINQIDRPYHILTGQVIYLRKGHVSSTKPATIIRKTQPVKEIPIEKEPNINVTYWRWPARGPIIGRFTNSNKGINIGGEMGNPIYATATGKVVYSGNGLRAYGDLIIIKHNNSLLSAYAHNRKALVHEGDWVKAGQKIAEMGDTGSRRVMLHFEIRCEGKPMNPLNYLSKG